MKTAQIYSQDFKELTKMFHKWVFNSSTIEERNFYELENANQFSHQELVSATLLNVLADKYHEFSKTERDNLVLMFLENEILEE